MAIIVDTPILVEHEQNPTNYLVSSKHRGLPTDGISVWLVDMEDELNCFINCYQNKWHNNTNGWGFILGEMRRLILLGRNLKNTELVIAKFVMNQNLWHGYPADLRYKPSDKPLPTILSKWYNDGLITKRTMTRIQQGQI